MISPDYFSLRWSWYRPILNRQEQPADRCRINVRRLPIRMAGQDTGEYIPFAAYPEIDQAITGAIVKLHEYTVRYMVRGEKVSAHQLPAMDERARTMVAWLRKQHPHISRDLLHHWCADPKGAKALLTVCEVLWEQGWKQDQADAAPWVPAVNVLLLRMIRHAMASLPEKEAGTTGHVLHCVTGSLYLWALQEFLQRYLEGVVEITRIANYESMMLPATPMAFMPHQPDDSLLADDSRLIRAYGLEPEIVPQMRYQLAKVGANNEGGILALLAREKLGNHMLRRSWARLSLWKLALKTGQGSWMRWVLNAKLLDQLLADQSQLDSGTLEALKANRDEPVAAWLLAQREDPKAIKAAGEPWLRDKITLLAFRVFEEDVRVEIARRAAEKLWLDRRNSLAALKPRTSASAGNSGLRATGGLRGGRNVDDENQLEKAWQDGELVLIQPDVTRALHSGKRLSLHHGCLRIDWTEYLARVHLITGESKLFIAQKLMPILQSTVEPREALFLDACSASGCLLRGPITALLETATTMRHQLHKLWLDADTAALVMPPLSMCIDMASEWDFNEQELGRLGRCRIAFSPAIMLVDAGVSRNGGVAQLMQLRDDAQKLQPIGGVNVEPVRASTDRHIHLLHNTGLALTASAVNELTRQMKGKANMQSLRVSEQQAGKLLSGFRLPSGGLELLVIHRIGEEGEPWLLLKAGKPNLAGIETELFELLDPRLPATAIILKQGIASWS